MDAIEKFTDMSTTCTRSTTVAGKEAVQIAEEVNWHSHSKSCRKEGSQCRWKFPRFPLAKTKFIDVNRLVNEEEYRMSTQEREDILRRVIAVWVEEKHAKTILSDNVLRIMNSSNIILEGVRSCSVCVWVTNFTSNSLCLYLLK